MFCVKNYFFFAFYDAFYEDLRCYSLKILYHHSLLLYGKSHLGHSAKIMKYFFLPQKKKVIWNNISVSKWSNFPFFEGTVPLRFFYWNSYQILSRYKSIFILVKSTFKWTTGATLFPRMPAGSLFIITKSKVPDCHMIMAFGLKLTTLFLITVEPPEEQIKTVTKSVYSTTW